ncbi:hypothetical protein T439DRAFT_376707 [Meredithblackwellia eburnea MCA 4105]
MVQLHLTEALVKALGKILPSLPTELADQVALHLAEPEVLEQDGLREVEDRLITHDVLVNVSIWNRKQKREDAASYTFAALLQLTEVYAPPLKPRKKSPELLAILSSLQLAQDKATYASMTRLDGGPSLLSTSLLPLRDAHDPSQNGKPAQTIAEEWAEVGQEVGAILNVVASMLAVGTAVWWVGGGRSYAARLSLAMSGAAAIAAVEGVLYYFYFNRKSIYSRSEKKSKGGNGGSGAVLAFPAPSVALR